MPDAAACRPVRQDRGPEALLRRLGALAGARARGPAAPDRAGGRRHRHRDRQGRDLLAGGRIGLRQVDGGAPGGRPLSADRGLDRVRRQRHGRPAQPRRHGGAAPAHADDLPGPVRQPQSALARVRHHRRADPRLRPGQGQGRSREPGRRAACARCG